MSKLRSLAVLTTLATLATLAIAVTGLTTSASASGVVEKHPAAAIYSSLVQKPGNLPSVGAEAYSFSEFGNQVTFAGTNRHLTRAVVTLSSWGCSSGSWTSGNCSTPAGATFTEPITLNVYNPSPDGINPGALITSVTQTFAIPYRPSASTKCTGAQVGEWYDAGHKSCFNGKAVNVTFTIGGTVPGSVVYGIAYNTSHYGYHPYGSSTACYTSAGGCGYDSLNIGLSQDPANVKVGLDTRPGTVWQNAAFASDYCDSPSGTTGTFRLDSPATASCWGVNSPSSAPFYVPAIQFTAVR